MFQLSKKKVLIARLTIATLAYGFIIYKLYNYSWHEISSVFEQAVKTSNHILLFTFLLLMPVNWLIEAIKWKLSIKSFESTTLLKAFGSVWYGVVTGIITPNRIGEPIGRIASISAPNRAKAALAAVWCSATQQIATIFFGIIGLVTWGYFPCTNGNFSNKIIIISIIVAAALLGLLLFIFKINSVANYLGRKQFFKKLTSGEEVALNITLPQSSAIIGLSIFRYIVFATQFILILKFLGVNVQAFMLFSAISLTYLFASFVPTFFFSEAGVRAGFALAFVGSLTSNSIAVVSATITLWLLNVGLPAAIASWFPWYNKKLRAKRS